MRRMYLSTYKVTGGRIIGFGLFSSKRAKKTFDRQMEKEHDAIVESRELQYAYGAVMHCGSGKITPALE